MDNKQGNVEQISSKTNAAKIDGEWYTLADQVKISYIKKGPCEYRTEEMEEGQNDLLVFCRSNQTPQKTQTAVEQSNDNRTLACIYASAVFHGTGKSAEFKELADELHSYFQKGIFVSN